MNEASAQLMTIFAEALECPSAEERFAYLERACGGAAELRVQVEALLLAYNDAGDFLRGHSSLPGMCATVDEPRPTETPGTVIGPYKLLQQVGEGGMGTVFMAEQTQPVKRKVALKLIKPGMDSRQVIARFEAERQALAMMDHVNIARVFDAGTTDSGRPYFVMELVHGVPITKYCDDNQLTPRARLELFVPVCQAIQHAHQKGVIHRDIKPSNVMVTLYDGKPVPKVIDFGVAKATEQKLTERTLFTQYGTMVGTLEYMSPEQAETSALGVDTRSDIYSLGVLLYELLTGSTPLTRKRFKDAAHGEILRIIKEEEPPKLSTRLSDSGEALASISAQRKTEPAKLSKLMRGELDWIVMRALEKERNRRYESASAFAADVQRYLNDEPVLACPPSAWYRFRKFARRNRRAVATAAAAALVAVGAMAGLATSTFLIAHEQRTTAKALQAETRAKDDLRHDAYFHRITLAQQDLAADNLGRALKLLEECPEDLRQWEWFYLMRLCRIEPLVLRDETEVDCVAFSPHGERLASAGEDGKIKVWNSGKGALVQTLPNAHTNSVVAVAFHPDGRHLASAGADGQVKVWDLTIGREVFHDSCDPFRKFGSAHTVAFSSPDGRQLAAGKDGAVRVWDWETRQLLHTFPGHDHHSISVAFSRDGRRLATGSWRDGPRLWDLTTEGTDGPPLLTLSGYRAPISALAFSPDGLRLATASLDRSVKVWDTTTGELLHTFSHSGTVLCVAFSPDGLRLASAGEDKTVHIWDATPGHEDREVLGLRGHTDLCGCVAFSPDGLRLASASADRTIRIWDATPLREDEGKESLIFTQHSDDEIRSVAFSPDGRWIASAGQSALVKVWDAATGRPSLEFNGNTLIIFGLAWQPDGQRIAAAGSDGRQQTVKVWDVRNPRQPAFALPPGQEYFAVAFSPDGKYLVTGRLNGDVEVWDAGIGRPVGILGAHDGEVRAVVFSSNGKHLASASPHGEVKLWDATRLNDLTKKQEARLTLHARVPRPSLNVAFSPDSQRLATGGEDNTIKIWDVQTGQELQTLRGHSGEVYTLAFSADGRWVASGGEDSTVKVWDSHTGKVVRSFRGHTGLVSSVAFSPDGRRLVSGSRDFTVKVWDLTPLTEVPER
jgi:eukaryotic-like serine/threonine-protein kinase